MERRKDGTKEKEEKEKEKMSPKKLHS